MILWRYQYRYGSVNTALLINSLGMCLPTVNQVWFADNSAGAARNKALYDWYKHLGKELKGKSMAISSQRIKKLVN